MALTTDDYTWIRQRARSDPDAWAVFRAWGLSKATWYALFQALEDWFVGAFASTPTESMKAAVDSVVGSSTNPQALAVIDVYIDWKQWKRAQP